MVSDGSGAHEDREDGVRKPGRLSVRWSKAREHGVSRLNGEMGDVLYEWGDGCGKNDGGLLHYHLGVGRLEHSFDNDSVKYVVGKSLLEELHDRGYDLRTLKFSIKKRITARTEGQ